MRGKLSVAGEQRAPTKVSPEKFLQLARDPAVSDHELYSQIKGWEKGQVVDGPWTVEGRHKHFKHYYEFEDGIYQDELKIPLEEFLELARDPYVTDEELYSHIKPVPGERMAIKGHPLGKKLNI